MIYRFCPRCGVPYRREAPIHDFGDTTAKELMCSKCDPVRPPKPFPGVEPPVNVRCPQDGDLVFLDGGVRVIKSVELYKPCPRCLMHQRCDCPKPPPAEEPKCPKGHCADPDCIACSRGGSRLTELREKYAIVAQHLVHKKQFHADILNGVRSADFDGVEFQNCHERLQDIAVINELLDILEEKKLERLSDEIAKEKPISYSRAYIEFLLAEQREKQNLMIVNARLEGEIKSHVEEKRQLQRLLESADGHLERLERDNVNIRAALEEREAHKYAPLGQAAIDSTIRAVIRRDLGITIIERDLKSLLKATTRKQRNQAIQQLRYTLKKIKKENQ